MSHWDATRGASGYVADRCNCWFDAYQAINGVCPVVDMEFVHCEHTVAPVVCTGEAEEELEVFEEPEEETEGEEPTPPDPTPPSVMPSRGRRRRNVHDRRY
jgi:hypothetical protein